MTEIREADKSSKATLTDSDNLRIVGANEVSYTNPLSDLKDYVLSRKDTVVATHIANSYCTSTATARISLVRPIKSIGILRCNLNLDSGELPTSTPDTAIAQLNPDWVTLDGACLCCIAPQDSSKGTLLMNVKSDGTITISNYSGKPCSGWYRTIIPLSLA